MIMTHFNLKSVSVLWDCLTLSMSDKYVSYNSCWLLLLFTNELKISWKGQKLAGMIWQRCSKQNYWDMLYLRVIPRKSRFYIKSQFWKSFHWGHFLSKDQLVPLAQWVKILSEKCHLFKISAFLQESRPIFIVF